MIRYIPHIPLVLVRLSSCSLAVQHSDRLPLNNKGPRHSYNREGALGRHSGVLGDRRSPSAAAWDATPSINSDTRQYVQANEGKLAALDRGRGGIPAPGGSSGWSLSSRDCFSAWMALISESV